MHLSSFFTDIKPFICLQIKDTQCTDQIGCIDLIFNVVDHTLCEIFVDMK